MKISNLRRFLRWREYSQTVENFHVGGILKGGCVYAVAGSDEAAYNAPFPSDEYKAGARQFPVLVPITPDDPLRRPIVRRGACCSNGRGRC
ncbi:MAG: hypothetical protein U0Y68_07250 [Blastocatellia bacterium]